MTAPTTTTTSVTRQFFLTVAVCALVLLAGCAGSRGLPMAPTGTIGAAPNYLIGPGDTLQVFVWQNPDMSVAVTVQPDGRVTTPLAENLVAAGKTPSQLAREIEKSLSRYINEPVVTVMVNGFAGTYSEQVRVIGQAAKPQALPYRDNMSLLDVMIEVGGLTDYAAGNRATIVRRVDGHQQQLRVRLDDLLEDGDISANVPMRPGDILIIPEAWF